MAIAQSRRRMVAAAAAAFALSACGGGISLWIGPDDDPPSVSLAALPTSAAIGQLVRLSASASDDFGVDFVVFYRVEANGSVVTLGSDGVAPFEFDTPLPSTTAVSVRYFARAVDGIDQTGDSPPVDVLVLR